MKIIKNFLLGGATLLFFVDLFLIPGALFLMGDVYSVDQITALRIFTILLMLVVIVLILFAGSIKENR